MYEVHGWLMSLAWGVLAPAAIVLAYNFRNVGPTSMWFHAHRILMVSSLTESLIGHSPASRLTLAIIQLEYQGSEENIEQELLCKCSFIPGCTKFNKVK